MSRFAEYPRALLAVRNLYFSTRIRLAGGWDRIKLYEQWFGGFGSRSGAVRITGVPDFGSEPWLIHFGENVTVADGVRFLTHDGATALFRQEDPGLRVYGEIRIGDNVFIGASAILLPNVEIGSNSVVGAGSVVTRDVESGTIVGGNPARVIKTVDEYRTGLSTKSTQVTPDDADRRIERTDET